MARVPNFVYIYSHLVSSHLALNREGRLDTTDDFATSVIHFSRFSTALWDLANSRPVHSLMRSSQQVGWGGSFGSVEYSYDRVCSLLGLLVPGRAGNLKELSIAENGLFIH